MLCMSEQQPITPPAKTRFVTRAFVLLFIINFLSMGSFVMLYATMARYAILTFACSDAIAGLTSSIFLVAAIIGRPLCARYGDRLGLHKTTIAACALTLVGCLLYFVSAGSLILLMFSRCLHGLSFGVASTATPSLVAKSIPREVVGTGTGWFTLSNTLSTALGPLVGLTLSNNDEYGMLFTLCCAFALVSLALACLLKPAMKRTQAAGSKADTSTAASAASNGTPAASPASATKPAPAVKGWRSLVDPGTFLLALFMFLQGLAYGCFNAFLNGYSFEIKLENVAPYLFAINAVATLATRPLAGKLMDLKGENTVMLPHLALATAGYFMLAFANNAFMLIVAGVFLALGWGNCMSFGVGVIARDLPPERTTVGISTFLMMCDMGMGVGPFILGFALTALGYSNLYIICGFITALALASYWFFHGRKHRGKA